MKKIILLFLVLCGVSFTLNAQDIVVSSVKVDTRSKQIIISVALTRDGVQKVYDENKTLRYEITADWSFSAYLNRAKVSNTFYAFRSGSNNLPRTGEIISMDIIDSDGAERIAKRGLSPSDFTITSSTR